MKESTKSLTHGVRRKGEKMSVVSFPSSHDFGSRARPAPYDGTNWPEFPLDVMPRPVAEYAGAVSRSVGCPLQFAAAGCLAAMSSAIGATRQLEIRPGWREQASLYICLLGPSGSGKTPALALTVQPAIRMLEELARNGDYRSAAVTEATTEALALLLRENERGVLLHPDELSSLLDYFGAYRGGRGADRQFFCSCWSGQRVQVTRVNRAQGPRKPEIILIPRPFLTVIGGLQPCRLDAFGARKMREDGLLQRFLFAIAPESPPPVKRSGLPKHVVEAYGGFLRELASCHGTRYEHDSQSLLRRFSRDARELFDAAAEDLDQRDSEAPDLRLYAPKLRANMARLALILHEADVVMGLQAPDIVDQWTVARAFELTDFFLGQYELLLRLLVDSDNSGRVLRLVEAAQAEGGEISLRVAYTRHIGGATDKAGALELFHSAARMGLGRLVQKSPRHGGRAQTVFVLYRS